MGHTANSGSTKEYVSDDKSTFFKRNKKKIIFGSIGACCFIFVVVMIGLIVPIVMLTKTYVTLWLSTIPPPSVVDLSSDLVFLPLAKLCAASLCDS